MGRQINLTHQLGIIINLTQLTVKSDFLGIIIQVLTGSHLPAARRGTGGDRAYAACQDSLHRMEERTGQPYDWYMDLDITSSLRTELDIENAFAKKQSRDDLDLVFSVCEARRNPWFNMVKTVDDHVEQVCKSEFTASSRDQLVVEC